MTVLMDADTKVRLVLMVPDELRAALRLESAKRDEDMAALVADWIRSNCADSLAEVRQRAKKKRS